MRLLLLIVALSVSFLIPFVLLGGDLEAALGGSAGLMGWSTAWAWLAGLGLLVADLLLPVPASGVQAGLGAIYGPLVGGALSSLGLFLAGTTGYLLGRLAPAQAVRRLLGEAGLRRGSSLSTGHGGWLIALTRPLPVLPEVLSVAAGLLRMPAGRFAIALAAGCIPTGFAYALVGHLGADRPLLTLGGAVLVPGLIWAMISRLLPPEPSATTSRPRNPAL